MINSNFSRRGVLGLGAGAVAAAGLAACGSSGPSGSSSTSGGGGAGSATYWYLSGAPQEAIRKATVDRFDAANPKTKITGTSYANDAYKTKITTALGAGQGPDIIWGWGGGGLKSWVDAGQVEDLTDWFGSNPDVKSKLFPSSFGAATVNGKIYAMPAETVTPIVLFYNKKIFDQVGVQPPQSWGDIMAAVPKFLAKGIAPFSLGGQSRWTNMMWLEFLLDRIAGQSVFQNVFNGTKNAWSDPAVTQMLTMVQTLVRAKGFVKGFESITADSNADLAVFYTGRAAMILHGAWTYGTMESSSSLVSSGALGYMNFPPVDGGKGDPSDSVGNPGQYLSINAKASDAAKETAKNFFKTAILDTTEVKAWVDSGNIPITSAAQPLLASAKDSAWLQFQYDIASKAKGFAQSWDQALSPAQAEVLLDNIAKLFQLTISPSQWIDNMNGVIGK